MFSFAAIRSSRASRVLSTRAIQLSARTRAPHSADSYSKEVDVTPPDDKSIHRVDPSSETVQKPHEPPSGQWSQAGVKTSEYRTVDEQEGGKYGQGDQRYGGVDQFDKQKNASKPEDGPEGGTAGGHKPEGR